MDLSLSAAELEHLGALGVSVAADGSMRSVSGREVSAGTAVQLLAKAAVSPAAFQRGYLREGHAAENASPVSAEGPAARPGPAGPPGPVGSGTADRSMMAGDDDDDLVPGGDEDGEGVGPSDAMAKGLVPSSFHRPFLAAGHQADSPANTGQRGTTAIPSSDPVDHRDFTRGYLTAGHATPSPDDAPGASNPHYRVASERYNANQGQVRAEHVMPSETIVSQPSASRMALPQDMMAAAVSTSLTVAATRPSPGETR